jgi:uncharacterized protein YndB with AHSA1/START domain
MQPKGTIREDRDHATLAFRRVYAHAIEHVWDAISTEQGLSAWLMCTHVRIEGRAGGHIELVSGPARYHSSGLVLAWDPPYLLEYEWNVAALPEMPHGERAIFRFELERMGESTQLFVTYKRITRQTARGFLPGLHAFLDRLEAQLDGCELPDWLERFAALRADYPEWSHDAPDPAE